LLGILATTVFFSSLFILLVTLLLLQVLGHFSAVTLLVSAG
jgi:hypothetical protein